MDIAKQERLEKAGWQIGSIEEFFTDTQPLLLQWRRTKSNGGLELWVKEQAQVKETNKSGIYKWVKYLQSEYYVVDPPMSTMSGFHTAQRYLKLEATYLPITPEDYKVPEEY
jgi:hypothetical protein